MPPKVRQLKAKLAKAGFSQRSGKGSHTVWRHPAIPEVSVTVSGNNGDDAERYQIKDVENALKRLRGI
jgi:predicted RNA binding protein YcfA (HicA-like mRNA interferase family)